MSDSLKDKDENYFKLLTGKFIEWTELAKMNNGTGFLVKNFEETKPKGAKDDDIHYEPVQYGIAMSYLLAELDNPNKERLKKIKNKEIYDKDTANELINFLNRKTKINGNYVKTYNQTSFTLPYDTNTSSENCHLVFPGINLFGVDSEYRSLSRYQTLIRYLSYVVAASKDDVEPSTLAELITENDVNYSRIFSYVCEDVTKFFGEDNNNNKPKTKLFESVFKQSLHNIITEIKQKIGKKTNIVLPGFPETEVANSKGKNLKIQDATEIISVLSDNKVVNHDKIDDNVYQKLYDIGNIVASLGKGEYFSDDCKTDLKAKGTVDITFLKKVFYNADYATNLPTSIYANKSETKTESGAKDVDTLGGAETGNDGEKIKSEYMYQDACICSQNEDKPMVNNKAKLLITSDSIVILKDGKYEISPVDTSKEFLFFNKDNAKNCLTAVKNMVKALKDYFLKNFLKVIDDDKTEKNVGELLAFFIYFISYYFNNNTEFASTPNITDFKSKDLKQPADNEKIKKFFDDYLKDRATIVGSFYKMKAVYNNCISDQITEYVENVSSIILKQMVTYYQEDFIGKTKSSSSSSTETFVNSIDKPEIYYLFKFIMNEKNTEKYSEYFNIVDIHKNAHELTDEGLKKKVEEDKKSYRFNLKKQGTYTGGSRMIHRLFGGMRPLHPIIENLLPIIKKGCKIWYNKTDFIQVKNGDELKDIFYDVFVKKAESLGATSASGAKSDKTITITINDKVIEITPEQTIKRQEKHDNFDLNFSKIYHDIISKNRSGVPQVNDEYKMIDDVLKTIIVEDMKKNWTRTTDPDTNADIFIYVDPDKKTEHHLVNDCYLIENDAEDCWSLLQDCIYNDKDFPEQCMKFAKINKEQFDPSKITPVQIKEHIQRMNPQTAVKILSKFGFLTKTVEVPLSKGSSKKMTRYVCESVTEWFEGMKNSEERKKRFTEVANIESKTEDQVINEFAKNATFVAYMRILVLWVNANPTVLNPSELPETALDPNIPKPNERYKMWRYYSPYKNRENYLRHVNSELGRLKSSIDNYVSGYDGSQIINTIASTPIDLRVVGNPETIVSSLSPAIFRAVGGSMTGTEVENQLEKITNTYGYNMFKDIYNSLEDVMNSASEKRKIKLSLKSKDEIEKKLESLKNVETEIRKSIFNMIERTRLYKSSYGRVNSYAVSDEDLPKLLEKHSNLMNLTSTYNKKSVGIINLLQALTTAVLGKVENSSDSAQKGVGISVYGGRNL